MARAVKADKRDSALEEQVGQAYNELRKWVDIKGAEYVGIHAGREARRGRLATAIKVRLACGIVAPFMSRRRIAQAFCLSCSLLDSTGEHSLFLFRSVFDFGHGNSKCWPMPTHCSTRLQHSERFTSTESDLAPAQHCAQHHHQRSYCNAACGMQALDAAIDDKEASKPAGRALREQRLALLRQLGWHHWAALEAASIAQSFPPDYAPL
jgi:hypothetical protein